MGSHNIYLQFGSTVREEELVHGLELIRVEVGEGLEERPLLAA